MALTFSYVNNCCAMAAGSEHLPHLFMVSLILFAALVIYYHAASFHNDVDLFWKSKVNLGTVICFTNRYSMLLYQTINLVSISTPSFEVR